MDAITATRSTTMVSGSEHPYDPDTQHPRHDYLSNLTSLLTDVMWGHDAEKVAGTRPPTVLALPAFAFCVPLADIGRKSREPSTGRTLSLPVRLQYTVSDDTTEDLHLLTLEPGREVTVRWRARGIGYDESGTTTLQVLGPGVWTVSGVDGRLVPDDPSIVRLALIARTWLRRSERDGLDARWRVALGLTPWIRRALRRKIAALAYELAEWGIDLERADETALDQMLDSMLVGRRGNSSPVLRLVDSMLHPAAFVKADPLRKAVVTVARDAEYAVREYFDDPRCGTRVRRTLAELGCRSLDELTAACRQRHPSDRITKGPVRRALATVGLRLPETEAVQAAA